MVRACLFIVVDRRHLWSKLFRDLCAIYFDRAEALLRVRFCGAIFRCVFALYFLKPHFSEFRLCFRKLCISFMRFQGAQTAQLYSQMERVN